MITQVGRNEYKKKWRENNPVLVRAQKKKYYEDNKEKILEKQRLNHKKGTHSYLRIKEKRDEYLKSFYLRHPNYERDRKRIYEKKRMSIDISFKLKHILRNRLRNALRQDTKKGSAVKLLGCTIDEFKKYLESKFLEGMSWENYGFRGWHIDHIHPLSLVDLTSLVELKKACHYTNLQPLWWRDNIKKGNKLDYSQVPIDKYLPLSVL